MVRRFDRHVDWIFTHFNTASFSLVFIFGSVVLEKEKPNDLDLCLVTMLKMGTKEWTEMKKKNDQLSDEFAQMFNMKLSIQLLTVNEYNEKGSFVTKVLGTPILFVKKPHDYEFEKQLTAR